MAKKKLSTKELPLIGWREWVALPDLGIEAIKVKVDTGARSSSLHAFNERTFQRDEKEWIAFEIHPLQRNSKVSIEVEAPLLEYRKVRSSSGHSTRRPVILVNVQWLEHRFPIELTLARRDQMGFRMLLGRQAVRKRFLVDSGHSYVGGRPSRR